MRTECVWHFVLIFIIYSYWHYDMGYVNIMINPFEIFFVK